MDKNLFFNRMNKISTSKILYQKAKPSLSTQISRKSRMFLIKNTRFCPVDKKE